MTTNSHPLEDLFNLEPGSTPFKFADTASSDSIAAIAERAATLTDPTTGEVVERKTVPTSVELEKEERIEDLHIDVHLDTIRSAAYGAFEQQARLSQEVDPKFSARNAEVAAQYLNIALNAVNSRVDAKFKRQKVRMAKQDAGAPAAVNTTIIIDRNVLLQELLKQKTVVIENEAE
jgi:hypothetical protein